MELIKNVRELSLTYAGPRGEAVLTRNWGNRDREAKWQVSVVVDGEYRELAKRANFEKAYAMAEKEIG